MRCDEDHKIEIPELMTSISHINFGKTDVEWLPVFLLRLEIPVLGRAGVWQACERCSE